MKSNIRYNILNIRKKINKKAIHKFSLNIISKILKDKNYINANVVGIYKPINNEVDIELLTKDSSKIFVYPKIVGNNLEFYSSNEFELNKKYNILEPKGGIKYENIDICFIPSIAIFKNLNRIGYGGGYYDRFLKEKNIYKVGIIYNFQYIDKNLDIFQDFDIKLDTYYTNDKISAILLGAGQSVRYKNSDKLFEKINDVEIYKYTLKPFIELGFDIILVSSLKNMKKFKNNSNIKIIQGGMSRQLSVLNALKYVDNKIVFIHDLARPLIDISDLLNLYSNYSNAGIFMASRLTNALKYIEYGKIIDSDRNKYIQSLTPQVFNTKLIKKAYQNMEDKIYYDDVEVFLNFYKNKKLKILYTEKPNIKITYKSDLELIKKLISKPILIGKSYDLHKLIYKKDSYILLGNYKIKSDYIIDAISDGDVLLHAISESILGALSKGDLGDNFNPFDYKSKELKSIDILKKSLLFMRNRKYKIRHIDILLCLEKPMLYKYKQNIISSISSLLNIDVNFINIKATTNEKYGLIGKNEAIAAECYCILEEL